MFVNPVFCADGNFYCGQWLQLVFSLTVMKDEIIQHGRHDVLEKPKMSRVNPDDWHGREVEAVNGLQKCSIPTDTYQQICIFVIMV